MIEEEQLDGVIYWASEVSFETEQAVAGWSEGFPAGGQNQGGLDLSRQLARPGLLDADGAKRKGSLEKKLVQGAAAQAESSIGKRAALLAVTEVEHHSADGGRTQSQEAVQAMKLFEEAADLRRKEFTADFVAGKPRLLDDADGGGMNYGGDSGCGAGGSSSQDVNDVRHGCIL